MWNKVFQKHCSDEVLLAHLDGELDRRRELSAQGHLDACWECRSRLAELELQAERTGRLFAQSLPEDFEKIQQAKRKILARWAEGKVTAQPFPQFHLLSAPRARLSLAVATLTLLLVISVGSFFWFSYERTQVNPVLVLSQTRNVETVKLDAGYVLHQTLQVQAVRLQPDRRERDSELQVWTEPAQGRFAAKWESAQGKLKYALWRPRSSWEYVYSSDTGNGVVSRKISTGETNIVPVSLLSDTTGGEFDPEQLELKFIRWVKGQRWNRISLTSDLLLLRNQAGVTLRAERATTDGGQPVLRLVAERMDGSVHAQIALEIDAASYAPRSEVIRYQSGEQVSELRLKLKNSQLLQLNEIPAAIFEPDPTLVAAAAPAPIRVNTPEPAPAPLTSPELAALEIEVLQGLDKAGAILGEQATLKRTSDGKIVVDATVENEQRKTEILEALKPVAGSRAVQINVQTVADALELMARAEEARVIARDVEVTSEPTPVEEELQRLFQQRNRDSFSPPSRPDSAQVRKFAKQMLDDSQQALLHAWALKHFVERFTPEDLQNLPPDALAKWQGLIREHARGFSEQTEKVRDGLQLVFGPASQSSNEKQGNKLLQQGPLPGNLADQIDRLLRLATHHDEAIRAAFVVSSDLQTLDNIKSPQFRQSLEQAVLLAHEIEFRQERNPRK